MNCNQMETVILNYIKGDYVSGRLHGADRAAAESHLAACAGCRERAEGFGLVARVLDDWDTPEISPWFNARLRQRIASEEAARWNWTRPLEWLRRPATAAAFATILVAGSAAVWIARPAEVKAPVKVQAPVQHKTDELMPVVDDFDMLANFDVITELKDKPKKNEI
jgi:anti-sigma factor RsiW